jgi:hypothetical protein
MIFITYGNSHPQITYLDEYYLTNAEIDVLTTWGSDMAQNIQSGTMVVELGSGSVFIYWRRHNFETIKLILIQQSPESEDSLRGIGSCWQRNRLLRIGFIAEGAGTYPGCCPPVSKC